MRLPRTSLKLFFLAGTALSSAAMAQELPSGASVAAGSVSVATPAAGSMTINQSTPTAIVNWQSFSIGAGGSVTFAQPDGRSAILNRVTGSAGTSIAGHLGANGQVFIVNPNGIGITQSGTVSVGGFVGSTLGITDQDFLAGRNVFAGDGSSAGVSNAGRIDILPGGYAALIGGRVDNSGTIAAPLGKIGLGAAERVTLDFSSDGFLQVALPSDDGGSDALISNSGTISANGGAVAISAAAAQDAARRVVNLGGLVEARTVSGVSGNITLGGGGGRVTVTGRLDVSAADPVPPPVPQPRPAALGGNVTVTGGTIELLGASIDASGADGGGSIRIGGDFQGGGVLPHAGLLFVDDASAITADAIGDGDGGTVVLWSDVFTGFEGSISARGAGQGGGGMAEVSSSGVLSYRGLADLGAESGRYGELLLDPSDITIADVDTTTTTTYDPLTGTYTAPTGTSDIYVGDLLDQLALSNVTITTLGSTGSDNGDIFVQTPIEWLQATTLTLDAVRDIVLDGDAGPGIASVDIAGGGLVLQAGRDLRIAIGNPTVISGGAGGLTVTVGNQIIGDSVGPTARLRVVSGSELEVTAPGGISDGALVPAPLDFAVEASSAGNMRLTVGGALVLGPGTSIQSGGDLYLATPAFVNASGSTTALDAAGRLLIYTDNWTDTIKGGIGGTNLYGRTFADDPPPTIPGTGDVWIYAQRPTLTITSPNGTNIYGDPLYLEGLLTTTYTGAVNGDTLEQIVGNLSGPYALYTVFPDVGVYVDALRPHAATSLIGYDFVYNDGDFTVLPAPLTIAASNLNKPFGTTYTFNGTEYVATGLVGSDTIDSLLLASAGAPSGADLGTYAITPSGAAGPRLGNYTVTYVNGVFTVAPATQAVIPPPPPPPVVDSSDDDIGGLANAEVTQDSAQLSLQVLQQRADAFENELEQCQLQLSQGGDSGAYISCASNALESFGNAIDDPLIQLPPELQATVSVIRQTVQRMRSANTVAEARAAVGDLVDFVRAQTELVRAVEPETEALLVQHGTVMANALETLDLALVGAVEI
ncbi:filamentous hemagglutinin N-terminal domain-containing protein [Devosia sp. Root635]|uniref:two-partner secretion domain-containing protein n=1 Tax=Devosia sp. Root635 TaxID=1736575 RepID=UPI0006F987B5|nr:filamentous hemagglutinin N-terminal domain-containing protein [Devosia sp. Root635]KRA53058.1 hypothetical protein ASD80_13770 [Devosia sp. Root635]